MRGWIGRGAVAVLLALVAAVVVAWLVGSAGARASETTDPVDPPACDMICEVGKIPVEIATGFVQLGERMKEILQTGFDGVTQGLADGFRHLEEGLQGLGEAFQGLRDGLQRAIEGAADGLRSAVEGLGDQIRSGLEGLGDRLMGGLQGLSDKLSDLINGLSCGGDSCAGAQQGVGAGLGALQGKLHAGEWSGLAASYSDQFGAFAGCSCSLAPIKLGGFDGPLLNFCSGDLAQLAAISKLGTRVVMMIGALAASVRFIMSGVSYVGLVRTSSEGN